MPQAFIGFDGSVQLSVSLLHEVLVNPRMPIPDRMFHVATLKVIGPAGFCVAAMLLLVGSAGEWLHAIDNTAHAVNGETKRKRLTIGNTPLEFSEAGKSRIYKLCRATLAVCRVRSRFDMKQAARSSLCQLSSVGRAGGAALFGSAILIVPVRQQFPTTCGSGGTADALASGASWSNPVGVQIPASAPDFASARCFVRQASFATRSLHLTAWSASQLSLNTRRARLLLALAGR